MRRDGGGGMVQGMAHASAAREILRDSFTRIRELVDALTSELEPAAANFRADDQANSVAWLVWHATRVQDNHLTELTGGGEEVWVSGGWYERSGITLDPGDTGYGHDDEDVAKVRVAAEILDAYQLAVHNATLEYVDGLDSKALALVIDDSWDPPVTVSTRLVSVIGDSMQHLGQAAYVRGLADRR